jgi:hypothetical protein
MIERLAKTIAMQIKHTKLNIKKKLTGVQIEKCPRTALKQYMAKKSDNVSAGFLVIRKTTNSLQAMPMTKSKALHKK